MLIEFQVDGDVHQDALVKLADECARVIAHHTNGRVEVASFTSDALTLRIPNAAPADTPGFQLADSSYD